MPGEMEKNPLNFPSASSSATKPIGPAGPLVITTQTIPKLVPLQLMVFALSGNCCAKNGFLEITNYPCVR